jgi:hypothetical protein
MIKTIPTYYYQSFNADYALENPGEAYGGWKKTELPMDTERTAIVVMHATDIGTIEEVPGYYRCVEYLPRANNIVKTKFPSFLKKVRAKNMKLFHVASYKHVAQKYPGYYKTLRIIKNQEPEPYEKVIQDETLTELKRFKAYNAWVGADNIIDKEKGVKNADFYKETLPENEEEIVLTSSELFGLCKHYGINHLIYTGFAVNACLMISPCGLVDMIRHGIMCSIIPQLTTAVENKESCSRELNKAYGLWAFAMWGGFVYDLADIEKYLL